MEHILHICTHLPTSSRCRAGGVGPARTPAALVRILPLLRREQRNEVVVELGKGTGDGLLLHLQIYPRIWARPPILLSQRAGRAGPVAENLLGLKRLGGVRRAEHRGVLLSTTPAYRERFSQSSAAFESRRGAAGPAAPGAGPLPGPRCGGRGPAGDGQLLYEAPCSPWREKPAVCP